MLVIRMVCCGFSYKACFYILVITIKESYCCWKILIRHPLENAYCLAVSADFLFSQPDLLQVLLHKK